MGIIFTIIAIVFAIYMASSALSIIGLSNSSILQIIISIGLIIFVFWLATISKFFIIFFILLFFVLLTLVAIDYFNYDSNLKSKKLNTQPHQFKQNINTYQFKNNGFNNDLDEDDYLDELDDLEYELDELEDEFDDLENKLEELEDELIEYEESFDKQNDLNKKLIEYSQRLKELEELKIKIDKQIEILQKNKVE